jgi:hypothetical protein
MVFKSNTLSRAFKSNIAAMAVNTCSSDSGPFTGRAKDIIFLPASAAAC